MKKNELRKEKELDFVVYEPVKRLENTSTNKEKEEMIITKKYSGLYNRGKIIFF
jgi:hypothetical protein